MIPKSIIQLLLSSTSNVNSACAISISGLTVFASGRNTNRTGPEKRGIDHIMHRRSGLSSYVCTCILSISFGTLATACNLGDIFWMGRGVTWDSGLYQRYGNHNGYTWLYCIIDQKAVILLRNNHMSCCLSRAMFVF